MPPPIFITLMAFLIIHVISESRKHFSLNFTLFLKLSTYHFQVISAEFAPSSFSNKKKIEVSETPSTSSCCRYPHSLLLTVLSPSQL